jgi:hypothetical protein
MRRSAARNVEAIGNKIHGIQNKFSPRSFVMYAVIVICGLIGFYVLVISNAATQTASKEAEGGVLSGTAGIVSSSNASAGKAVKFGTGTVTAKMPLIGISIGGSSVGAGKWDTYRVYRFGDVDKAVSYGAKLIAMSDGTIDPEGGQTSANTLDTKLAAMFASHPNIEVHWGNGNEEDSHVTNGTAYLNTVKAMRVVIDKYRAQGRNISFWIDLTAYNVRNNPTVMATLKPTAPYLDGIACSFYPPGRTKTPIEYTDYATFVDPVFTLAKDWGIDRMDLWETGIGPDTNTTHTSSTNETATSVKVRIYGQSSLTAIAVPNLKQVRPTYAAYLARYVYEKGNAVGIPVETQEWWDQQKNEAGAPDDILADDPTGTSPTTATTWHSWQTYAK